MGRWAKLRVGTSAERKVGDVKVVLFSDGPSLRRREYADIALKPMIPIGVRPIIWHVMRYYAQEA